MIKFNERLFNDIWFNYFNDSDCYAKDNKELIFWILRMLNAEDCLERFAEILNDLIELSKPVI